MMLESRVVGDVYVLTPRKNLTGGEETKALVEAVSELAAAGATRIVVDLQRITWISSLGIEALRRIHRACAEGSGWFRLVNVGSRIKSVLLTMRLHWVFQTFDTIEEAVSTTAVIRAGSPEASIMAENENSRRRVASTPGI